MEVVSQTAIKVIDNTKTLYMFPWLIIAIFGLLLLREQDDKKALLALISLIGFTIVVTFAHRDSMYRFTGGYIYQMKYANNMPEVDTSKYIILGDKAPEEITIEYRDKLSDEEENSLKRTTNFTIIVTVYRIICLMIWFIYFTTFIENSALTISFKEDSYLSLIMGVAMVLCIFLSAIGIIIVTVVYGSHPFPI